MGRQLKLVRHGVTRVDYLQLGACRLRIEASDPNNTGADPYVFMHLRDTVNPDTLERVDFFEGVAGPVDMSEYPESAPSPDAEFPYFRLPYMEIDLRSPDQADQAWRDIIAAVNALLVALDKLEDLEAIDETYVGDLTESGGDSGSSQSSSTSVSESA